MFKRLGHALVLFAFLAAIGAHWFVLQSVAWSTMLADNLRTASLPQAIQRTFDGKHPCAMCKQIAKDKQSEKRSDLCVDLNKFEFSYSPAIFVFAAPQFYWEVRVADPSTKRLSHAPPVPPPRGLIG